MAPLTTSFGNNRLGFAFYMKIQILKGRDWKKSAVQLSWTNKKTNTHNRQTGTDKLTT